MNNRKHYIAALTAFIIWGFFSIPLRALSSFSAGQILYFRILFSALVLLVIGLGFRRQELKKDWQLLRSFSARERNQVLLMTLVGGLLLIVNWLVFIYVINTINIKTASFSYFICPVLTSVLAYFLLNEKLTRSQWLAIGICVLSCVLLGLNSALELGYSFVVAISYALYLVSQRKNKGFDRLTILTVQIIFSFIVLSCFYNVLVSTAPSGFKFYSITFVVGALFTVIPLFLNLYALNKIDSATVGVLLYINPLMNFVLAFVVFGERATTLQFIGYLLIVVAIVVFNYSNFERVMK